MSSSQTGGIKRSTTYDKKFKKKNLIQEKTRFTRMIKPSIDMKVKMKLNMGFLAFKAAKKTFPVKMGYKKEDISNMDAQM